VVVGASSKMSFFVEWDENEIENGMRESRVVILLACGVEPLNLYVLT
jgi:hypothetical protein